MRSSRTDHASALVLVISLIVLMAIMATAFLSLVSQRRGVAYLIAARQRLDIFLDESRDRIIGELMEDAGDPDGFTGFSDAWYRAHQAIDVAGDPAWTADRNVSPDPADNLLDRERPWSSWLKWQTFHMGHYEDADAIERIPVEQHLAGDGDIQTLTRWRHERFLDDDFQPVVVPAGVDPADEARYALRYGAAILDNNGLLRIQPDLEGMVPVVDSSDPRYQTFIRQQNYRTHFARSLKSMYGAHFAHVQRRPKDPEDEPIWPWDREYVNHGPSGQPLESLVGHVFDPSIDARLRLGDAFAGVGLTIENGRGGDPVAGRAEQWLPTGIISHGQMYRTAVGNAIWTNPPYYQVLMGRGRGLRGGPLGSDPATTPWRVNMLTAPRAVLAMVVYGLSDRIQRGANTDLFGPGHPEPFPLSHEEGRDLKVVTPGLAISDGQGLGAGRYDTYPGQQDEYFRDIRYALDIAIGMTRNALYLQETPADTASHIFDPASEPVPDRQQLRSDLMREFLRVLGEPDIRNVGGMPTSTGGIIGGALHETGFDGKMRRNTGQTRRLRDKKGGEPIWRFAAPD
ncbi:MAG: hypothetical protein ACOCXA_01375 [Planctomycetota bacterium]